MTTLPIQQAPGVPPQRGLTHNQQHTPTLAQCLTSPHCQPAAHCHPADSAGPQAFPRNEDGGFYRIYQPNKWRLKKEKAAAEKAAAEDLQRPKVLA